MNKRKSPVISKNIKWFIKSVCGQNNGNNDNGKTITCKTKFIDSFRFFVKLIIS